jgi:hypothetical protein
MRSLTTLYEVLMDIRPHRTPLTASLGNRSAAVAPTARNYVRRRIV